jgi:hypothetical protein
MAEVADLLSQVAKDGCLPCSWFKLKAVVQSRTKRAVEELKRKNAVEIASSIIQATEASKDEPGESSWGSDSNAA